MSIDHCDELFVLANRDKSRFDYLPDDPDLNKEDFTAAFIEKIQSLDPMHYAIIDSTTGVVGGRMSYMRITPVHGVLEIGHIYFGPDIARRRIATEALFLMLQYAFDVLGYRRVEWKCDNSNSPSKRSAERFGFTLDGVFRKHMIVKNGNNRDTAWYAMLDDDWGGAKLSYTLWLKNDNFTEEGNQIESLVVKIN